MLRVEQEPHCIINIWQLPQTLCMWLIWSAIRIAPTWPMKIKLIFRPPRTVTVSFWTRNQKNSISVFRQTEVIRKVINGEFVSESSIVDNLVFGELGLPWYSIITMSTAMAVWTLLYWKNCYLWRHIRYGCGGVGPDVLVEFADALW